MPRLHTDRVDLQISRTLARALDKARGKDHRAAYVRLLLEERLLYPKRHNKRKIVSAPIPAHKSVTR